MNKKKTSVKQKGSCLLHRINISCSNLVSLSLHLSRVNTFPAILNSCSTGDDEDGTPSTSFANFAITRCFFSFYFRNCSGLVVIETLPACKYASTSVDDWG